MNGALSEQDDPKTVDMSDVEIDLDFDAQGQGWLLVECPKCHRKMRIRAKTAKPGSAHVCPCREFEVKLTGDDLRDVQKGLDDLRRTFQKLGKDLNISL